MESKRAAPAAEAYIEDNPGHRVVRGDYQTFVTCLVTGNEFDTQDGYHRCPYCGQVVRGTAPFDLGKVRG